MTHSHVPSACRRATSAVTVPSGRRVEVSARTLISEGKQLALCHHSGVERSDGFPAVGQPAVAAIEDGIGLIKGQHSVDVSRSLAGNQQPLQILGITRGLTGFIAHRKSPLGMAGYLSS